MNAMYGSSKLAASMSMMDFKGWNHVFTNPEDDDGRVDFGSMAAAVAPHSPGHQHKRRRLSRLLDRLTVQIKNSNHYAPSRWATLDSSCEQPKTAEDAPLDLSKKPVRVSPRSRAVAIIPAQTHVTPKRAFSCSTCGETFAAHDRLAKHIASRHRNRTPDAQRHYECYVCLRRFARSDMLTRHSRLHSGVRPYACPVCGQVFSRSDHLATHQRTHTGEKPYHCPVCPYTACRRDMITRHMKTHSRKEAAEASI